MTWYEIGFAAFAEKGSALPANPDDVYCFDVGVAQDNGFIRQTQADALIAARPAASRPFRDVALRILRNLP